MDLAGSASAFSAPLLDSGTAVPEPLSLHPTFEVATTLGHVPHLAFG